VGLVKYSGQVTPKVSRVVYRIDFKKVILRRLVLGVADGLLEADGKPIYEARDLKVGLFNAADLA
jgi:3-hydroxyacyl-[acyl-carrier protein] dehydratase/trans-2-decenoyl-[acyl-carrier protein] isomerase